MGRRSPMSERYQKNTAPSGKTRKSASSAKLKQRAPESKKPDRPRIGLVPSTPEMKRWRRIWWVLMGIAISLALATMLPAIRQNETVIQVLFATELVAIGVALWIDWKKIRPLRQQAVEQAKREQKGK